MSLLLISSQYLANNEARDGNEDRESYPLSFSSRKYLQKANCTFESLASFPGISTVFYDLTLDDHRPLLDKLAQI